MGSMNMGAHVFVNTPQTGGKCAPAKSA